MRLGRRRSGRAISRERRRVPAQRRLLRVGRGGFDRRPRVAQFNLRQAHGIARVGHALAGPVARQLGLVPSTERRDVGRERLVRGAVLEQLRRSRPLRSGGGDGFGKCMLETRSQARGVGGGPTSSATRLNDALKPGGTRQCNVP